ncbi:TPA: DUF4222 domain-containing protein [Enterobacter roggenkampii]
MTIKNSGLAAGGRAHPEIRPGDKWKDGRGNIVIIESYRFDRVTYCREGYSSPCFCTPERLVREFELFLPRRAPVEQISIELCECRASNEFGLCGKSSGSEGTENEECTKP